MARVRLNSDKIADWQSFHQSCKEAMGFQDFYGMNMNAWIDCLSDLYKDTGMTRFRLSEGEAVHIEGTDTESFKSRLPEILDALIECSAFVNQRYVEDSKLPPISQVFLSKSAKEYSIHSRRLGWRYFCEYPREEVKGARGGSFF